MNQAISFGLLLGGGVLLVSAFSGKSLADVIQGKGPFTVGTSNDLSVAGLGAAVTTAGTSGSSSSSTGALSGSAQSMMSYLQAQGLSKIAAAGVIGNIMQESGGNPSEVGGGLAQDVGVEWSALTSFAGTQTPDAKQQLDFIVSQLRTGATGLSLSQLNAATSPAAAALLFSGDYEHPGLPMNANRERYAQQAYAGQGPF